MLNNHFAIKGESKQKEPGNTCRSHTCGTAIYQTLPPVSSSGAGTRHRNFIRKYYSRNSLKQIRWMTKSQARPLKRCKSLTLDHSAGTERRAAKRPLVLQRVGGLHPLERGADADIMHPEIWFRFVDRACTPFVLC